MIGAITPFVPLFYRELGMRAGEIGILSSISGVTALLCAPVWAAVADSLRIERKLVSLGMVAFAGLYLFMSQAGSFSVVLVINVLLAALPPIGSINDGAVLTALGSRRGLYGTLRMWGSLGYSIAALAVGLLVAATSLQAAFVAFMGMWVGAFICALRLPAVAVERARLRSGSAALVRNPRLLFFLIAAFLMSVGGTCIYGYRALYMQDLGLGTDVLGLSDAISASIEIPVMFASAAIIARLEAKGAILLAMLMFASCGALQLAFPNIGGVLVANAIRGIGFGLWLPSGVLLVQSLAPKSLVATAQSLLSLAGFTLSSLVGSAAAGFMYQALGPARLYETGIALVAAGALVMHLGVRALYVSDARANPG